MKKKKIGDLIKKKSHLIWYTKNYDALSEEAVVEAILNYGDWEDVQALIKKMGIKRVAKIFREKSKPGKWGRTNYRDRTRVYFSLYFNKYAPA